MEKSIFFKNTPLMREEWFESLKDTILSPFAPKWNTIIGDRITKDDYIRVKEFEGKLYENRRFLTSAPSEFIIDFVRGLRYFSAYFNTKLKNISIESEFQNIPFMTRDDLQNKITEILPADDPLNRLIINPTSGTTGKPILAPNHPYAIGCYVPLIEYSLASHNVKMIHNHKETSAIQLCYQNQTIVYASCHSLAGGAKFAKINLKEKEWKTKEDISRFLEAQSPLFLSGDPYAFEEALKIGINYKPKALHSTALELEGSLREALALHFQCPVINFYSLNETGPIAYSCPMNTDWLHILPHDIYVETIDTNGENQHFGEIVITGGRNPFLPLLRYRTGDFGELNFSSCLCGEKSPRLKLLKGRKPIPFTDTMGRNINPVDISRILRMDANILRHQFIQKRNGSYIVNISWQTPPNKNHQASLKMKFQELLGNDAEIKIGTDLPNDEGKIMVFVNENLTI